MFTFVSSIIKHSKTTQEMMKKLTLLLLGMLVLSLSFAQSVTLSGQVTDQLTGLPIPNHTVYLSADSSSGVLYWATVTTDAQGNYSDVAQVPANTAVNFYISTADCIGQWHTQMPQLAANGTTTGLPANFSICDSLVTGSCSASFIVSNVTGSQATFNATASTGSGAISYGWDFGDGSIWAPSTSTSQVAHSYNAPGTYIVCLTITDSSSCTSTYCDSVVISGTSGCQSFYTYNNSSVVGNRVYFYGSPTPSFGNTYAWNMGDGSTYGTRNVVHNYQNAGTYGVCLTITNTNGCTDTYCDTITVSAGAGPCDANFTITPDSSTSNLFHFTNTSTYNNTPATAYWTFGDGSTSRGFNNTSHTYWAAGTYTVCLHIVSGNCSDSTCQTITVTSVPSPTCSAGFTFMPDSTNGNRIYFNSTSTSSLSNPTYYWSFGDGNTRSGTSSFFQNPTYTYTNPGTYNVCHIIIAGNCSDTVCQTITTNGPTQPVYIGGQIMTGNNYAQEGMVYLIDYDANTQMLTAVDSTIIDSMGYYYFQANPGDNVTIKAALGSNDPNYAGYLPTYYGDSLLWSGATFITVPLNHTYTYNINMIAGTNPGGPGFVGGNVQQGANKAEGDPVAGVPVLLLDANMNAVAYTYSDANGAYAFNNLAYGTYYIHPDILNLPTNPLMVTISANSPSVANAIMVVNSTHVDGFITTSIDFVRFSEAGKVVPNPTTGLSSLQFTLLEASNIQTSIMDLTGKTLWNKSQTLAAGSHKVQLDLQELPAGVYLIKAATKDGEAFYTKLVKQ